MKYKTQKTKYKGEGNPMFGKKRPDRSKLNRERKGIFKQSKETKIKIKNSMKGKNKGEKNAMKNPIYLQRMKNAHNKINRKLWGEKISKSCIEAWKINKEEKIQKLLKRLMKRPTSYEKIIIKIIKKHNLPYKYTGDGRFLIGYKNPDFIHKEKKVCIEVYNNFHHQDNYEFKRNKYFIKYGWKTIFISEEILFDDLKVLNKIKNEEAY